MFGNTALVQAQQEIIRLTQLVDAQRAQYAELVREVIQLRRDGFVQPVPITAKPLEQMQALTPLERTIDDYADKAPNAEVVRKELNIFTIAERAKGKNDDQIIAAIHKGGSTLDEDDD